MDLYGKPLKQELFFSYKSFLFSLILRYMAEDLQVTLFWYALSAWLPKLFKRELFSCSPKVDHVINSCKGLLCSNGSRTGLINQHLACKAELEFWGWNGSFQFKVCFTYFESIYSGAFIGVHAIFYQGRAETSAQKTLPRCPHFYETVEKKLGSNGTLT